LTHKHASQTVLRMKAPGPSDKTITIYHQHAVTSHMTLVFNLKFCHKIQNTHLPTQGEYP